MPISGGLVYGYQGISVLACGIFGSSNKFLVVRPVSIRCTDYAKKKKKKQNGVVYNQLLASPTHFKCCREIHLIVMSSFKCHL